MEFVYESIGDEKFQKLCQSMLIDLFPNVQCLPVGQPDGGRDAFVRQYSGLIIFQVKFSRNPSLKSEREAIISLIESEKEKVKLLISKGATSYYLLTNISGTSHLDVGSIDRVNEELTKAFGIPSYVWWRDDIDRRIEASASLIWRYPELARGQDFLEFLSKERSEFDRSSPLQAFTAYMQAQYTKESEVKFQQVQIQSKLFDLFTDTPIGQARENLPTRESLCMSEAAYQNFSNQLMRGAHRQFDNKSDILAADWLLETSPSEGVQRIVIEGAPGQGKSTVTQYICQLHRAAALKKADAKKIPSRHRASTLRLPIRVDLRDYALWLTGKDPFASEKGVLRPSEADESLEALIAYQIHRNSGGMMFSVDDLNRVLTKSHAILVLDGFDEVADTGTRSKIIEQSRLASDRMSLVCASLQLIVTSRPAAFILSSGFSEKEWAHMVLLPLRREQIVAYTDKWIGARQVGPKEARDFKDLLLDRMNRPHIRSLAQNPMQLAILLNLISSKGMSLPDKRTALYDSYMDLFFGREAEKDEIVRENRDILIQIHQYVAWILQIGAEVPGGTGSISQSDLKRLVAEFLSEKEHKGDVLKLFAGAVERVGALVSRVQGMLEFEVQPLREYFAGRYLYETAPYSPPGAERRGTKPERFSGLSKRPYWSNVIRFYAGCYSSGELLSLVDGLEELVDSPDVALRVHALQLSALFLGDYVFAQEPKTVRKVVKLIMRGENFKYLVTSRSTWEENRLAFPDSCGRSEVANIAKSLFSETEGGGYLSRIGQVLRLNMSAEERWDFWDGLSGSKSWKLGAARWLGVFDDIPQSKFADIFQKYGPEISAELAEAGRWDDLTLSQRISGLRYAITSRPELNFIRRSASGSTPQDPDLYRVYVMMSPYLAAILTYNNESNYPLDRLFLRMGFFIPDFMDEDTLHLDEYGMNDIISSCFRSSKASVNAWRTELMPWSDMIESARRTWGDCDLINTLAAIAAGIKSRRVKSSGLTDLHDHNLPLAERARHARLQTSAEWWNKQIAEASDTLSINRVMLLLLAWAPTSVIQKLSIIISTTIDPLPAENWGFLLSSIYTVVNLTSHGRKPLTGWVDEDISTIKSVRLQVSLLPRLPKALGKKVLTSIARDQIDDRFSARIVAERMVGEALQDQKIWPETLEYLSKISHVVENESYVHDDLGLYYGHRQRMPLSYANIVAKDPSQFPNSTLALALNVLSSQNRARMQTLGKVATSERWFS